MLSIGLVNNMPPAAIHTTERQFSDILTRAAHAQGVPFEIRFFRLAGARPAHYEQMDNLWSSQLDGMIVTGVEPRADTLPNEPLWQPLTRLIDWASQHTASVICSCLAAHAAVYYFDGVERRLNHQKIFGLFDSERLTEHVLLRDTRLKWRVPHSRWNDLSETDLLARGYTILAKSADAGVDMFIKQFARSLFVFIQSHPEYSVDTLLREYRRDITRFRNGEQLHYPNQPLNYFDHHIATELESIRGDYDRGLTLLEQVDMPDSWSDTTIQLYGNWINYLLTMRR